VDIEFDIQLEERLTDRVFVSVLLSPTHEPVHIDGAAVEIRRLGTAVSARLLLPIVGTLTQPIGTTVELRAHGPIPSGARIVGTVWSGNSLLEVSCPCDPWTELEAHVCGTRPAALTEPTGQDLRRLSPHERTVVAALFPWINRPKRAPDTAEKSIVEAQDLPAEDVVGDLQSQYDLDQEDTAFLRELLEDDD
jgi:hypothetical protein